MLQLHIVEVNMLQLQGPSFSLLISSILIILQNSPIFHFFGGFQFFTWNDQFNRVDAYILYTRPNTYKT